MPSLIHVLRGIWLCILSGASNLDVAPEDGIFDIDFESLADIITTSKFENGIGIEGDGGSLERLELPTEDGAQVGNDTERADAPEDGHGPKPFVPNLRWARRDRGDDSEEYLHEVIPLPQPWLHTTLPFRVEDPMEGPSTRSSPRLRGETDPTAPKLPTRLGILPTLCLDDVHADAMVPYGLLLPDLAIAPPDPTVLEKRRPYDKYLRASGSQTCHPNSKKISTALSRVKECTAQARQLSSTATSAPECFSFNKDLLRENFERDWSIDEIGDGEDSSGLEQNDQTLDGSTDTVKESTVKKKAKRKRRKHNLGEIPFWPSWTPQTNKRNVTPADPLCPGTTSHLREMSYMEMLSAEDREKVAADIAAHESLLKEIEDNLSIRRPLEEAARKGLGTVKTRSDLGDERCLLFFMNTTEPEYLGLVEVGFYKENAARTADNFIHHCRTTKNYYAHPHEFSFLDLPVHVTSNYVAGGIGYTIDGNVAGHYQTNELFETEYPHYTHYKPGILTTHQPRPGLNGSGFLLTLAKIPELDGINMPFGEVTRGFSTLNMISMMSIKDDAQMLTEDCVCAPFSLYEEFIVGTDRMRSLVARRVPSSALLQPISVPHYVHIDEESWVEEDLGTVQVSYAESGGFLSPDQLVEEMSKVNPMGALYRSVASRITTETISKEQAELFQKELTKFRQYAEKNPKVRPAYHIREFVDLHRDELSTDEVTAVALVRFLAEKLQNQVDTKEDNVPRPRPSIIEDPSEAVKQELEYLLETERFYFFWKILLHEEVMRTLPRNKKTAYLKAYFKERGQPWTADREPTNEDWYEINKLDPAFGRWGIHG